MHFVSNDWWPSTRAVLPEDLKPLHNHPAVKTRPLFVLPHQRRFNEAERRRWSWDGGCWRRWRWPPSSNLHSGLLERKDHLVHLDGLHGLRAFACLVDEDDVDKAEIFSSAQNMAQAVFFLLFYKLFCTFLRSSPPRRIFCSCLRAERGAAGDSRQLSADLLLTRTNVVGRISCPKDQQVFREGRSGKGALGAIFWEDFGQIGRPCLLRSD